MTLEEAKAIVKAAARDGIELRVRDHYSGRGMFGEETSGVVGGQREIERYAVLAGVDFRWDQMGKSDYIAY